METNRLVTWLLVFVVLAAVGTTAYTAIRVSFLENSLQEATAMLEGRLDGANESMAALSKDINGSFLGELTALSQDVDVFFASFEAWRGSAEEDIAAALRQEKEAEVRASLADLHASLSVLQEGLAGTDASLRESEGRLGQLQRETRIIYEMLRELKGMVEEARTELALRTG